MAGDSATTTDTSLTWPANTTRYGFDTVKMDGSGNIYVRTFANGSNSDLSLSAMTVRIHGYYTGATAATAGGTYIGQNPLSLYQSATNTNSAIGPTNGNRPMPERHDPARGGVRWRAG